MTGNVPAWRKRQVRRDSRITVCRAGGLPRKGTLPKGAGRVEETVRRVQEESEVEKANGGFAAEAAECYKKGTVPLDAGSN